MEELKKKILELFTTHDNKIVWVRVRAPHFTSVNRDQARAFQRVARSVLHAIVGPRQENGLHIYHCSAFHAFLHCKLSSSPHSSALSYLAFLYHAVLHPFTIFCHVLARSSSSVFAGDITHINSQFSPLS